MGEVPFKYGAFLRRARHPLSFPRSFPLIPFVPAPGPRRPLVALMVPSAQRHLSGKKPGRSGPHSDIPAFMFGWNG